MTSDTQALLIFAVIGIVAGWLASFVVGGSGLLTYLISGVIGSFVGGYVLSALGVSLGLKSPLANQIATATIGAMIVVIVARILT